MTIVVGHLPTPEGREALEVAAREARAREVELVVVVTDKDGASPEQVSQRDAELAALTDSLARDGVAHRLVTGGRDVAEDLVAAAEEGPAELLVIGLRRRSPVGKLILGSNAQRILLDAPCPVLAVKPPRPA